MREVLTRIIPLLLIFVFGSLAFSFVPRQGSISKPGWTIKVLTGYDHKPEQGVDSQPGTIAKENGLTISYDIGGFAGEKVISSEKENLLWYKEQTLNKQLVRIAFTKKRELVATFPASAANFWCQINSEEDFAEALLIILSYQASGE